MPSDRPKVLIIDDEADVLDFLTRAVKDMDFEVTPAGDGEKGLAIASEEPFDLALVDYRLPGIDGIEVTRRLKEQDEGVTVVIITAYGSIGSAVEAMKAGATEYLLKPVDLDHLELVLSRAIEGREQAERLHLLEEQLEQRGSFEGMVGVSAEMQRVYGLIRRLADSDATILIQGETGTGKELVARAIHSLSGRRDGAFMPINCGALPEGILESELFGHEKGSFTGAVKQKYGLIEQAEGGTLFLDDIAEMSPALQVKLLRAIQEKEVLRIGGERPLEVDFRLVAASNVDLRVKMEQGGFRADLFYRLSSVVLGLPPLVARRGDIPLLVNHFVRLYGEKNGRPGMEVAPEAMMLLRSHTWPGNIRELEHAIEQSVLLSHGSAITVDDLPDHIAALGDEGGGALFDRHPAEQVFGSSRMERDDPGDGHQYPFPAQGVGGGIQLLAVPRYTPLGEGGLFPQDTSGTPPGSAPDSADGDLLAPEPRGGCLPGTGHGHEWDGPDHLPERADVLRRRCREGCRRPVPPVAGGRGMADCEPHRGLPRTFSGLRTESPPGCDPRHRDVAVGHQRSVVDVAHVDGERIQAHDEHEAHHDRPDRQPPDQGMR
ncbi:MAG: sigma-54 dependent transcriptional regulator, partial [Candidatus Latescibacteria bacterium]|nr:sigma-54 dependent transcriptional regulator [Candidatus Latescibacterota bacterium]